MFIWLSCFSLKLMPYKSERLYTFTFLWYCVGDDQINLVSEHISILSNETSPSQSVVPVVVYTNVVVSGINERSLLVSNLHYSMLCLSLQPVAWYMVYIYSGTGLQGTSKYPRDSVPTSQVSSHYSFLHIGVDWTMFSENQIKGCPLVQRVPWRPVHCIYL